MQPIDFQSAALKLCCLGRIRTLTGGTRIRRATITPQGNYFLTAGLTPQALCPVCECKFRTIFFITQILWRLFVKNFHAFCLCLFAVCACIVVVSLSSLGSEEVDRRIFA